MNQDAESNARVVAEFLNSEAGKGFIAALSMEYNDLHQSAEKAETNEAQAKFVNKAAGLKWAIEWVEARRTLSDTGYYRRKAQEGELIQ